MQTCLPCHHQRKERGGCAPLLPKEEAVQVIGAEESCVTNRLVHAAPAMLLDRAC